MPKRGDDSGSAPMSKLKDGDFRKVSSPPDGEPWVWITRGLIISSAWRSRSIHLVRLIEFLLREHMSHAGRENGNLVAPYQQLEEFGLWRRFIPQAIREGEALRLIAVHRGGKKNLVSDHMNRYRLTFFPEKRRDTVTSSDYYVAATNDWKKTTDAEIAAYRAARKTRSRHTTGEPNRFTMRELSSPHHP